MRWKLVFILLIGTHLPTFSLMFPWKSILTHSRAHITSPNYQVSTKLGRQTFISLPTSPLQATTTAFGKDRDESFYSSSATSSSQSTTFTNPFLSPTWKYNGKEIDEYYEKRPLEVWERLVDIGSPILGWYITSRWDELTARFHTAEENQRRLNARAEDFKDAIVQGRSVTFIKSGQALALRPDILKSPEYVRELQKLQDEVETFKNEIAMNIIRDELNQDPHEVFEFDPPEPIASASIGQVYRARLRRDNSLVAVKVQRPDAIASAALDMYILRRIAAFVKSYKKLRSDLVGIADEFGAQLFNELNYNQEGRNCLRFKSLYGDIPGIYVPSMYPELTRQRVLTMEFVEGVKGPWPVGGEKMLTIGLQCSVLQLLGTGFFHSDPHRGNLLQTPKGDLAYLDFGMMAEVPAAQRYALIGTVLGLVNKDLSLIINNLKTLKFFPPETDSAIVIRALDSALRNSTEGGAVSTLNFTRLNQNIESISYLLPLQLPPFYTLIVRTLTILEGLALYVDPSFRLIRGAYPFIAKQILTSPSPELTALLQDIIVTPSGNIRWDKLEQFISISSNADRALEGNFAALKVAQDRSDILKTYTGSQTKSNFTLEVSLQILDFLLSDNGKFLREPLINEIVETIDALGLTAISLASIATNGILPKPADKPDREKVEQFLSLLQSSLASVAASNDKEVGDEGKGSSNIGADEYAEDVDPALYDDFNIGNREGGELQVILSTVDTLLKLLRNPPTGQTAQMQALLNKSWALMGQVVAKLVEKNVVRAVKVIASPSAIASTLPVVGRLVEFLIDVQPKPNK